MRKNRIIKMVKNKYFIPFFVIIVNIIFFFVCNKFFSLRYETIDDFTITKIISKMDGTYSIYSIYIHPLLSFLIMMLYKTGININWYTITMLTILFVSFTTIGIVFINKNKKIGTFFYLMIIAMFYLKLLILINYTSVAITAILAGVIALLYYIDTNSKKSKIVGIILIAIGIMLRVKAIATVLPFYIIYSLYYSKKYKNNEPFKMLGLVIIMFVAIYASNWVIYKTNPIYDKYTKFNNIRTYFFDYNVLDYEQNEEQFERCGWSYNDYNLLYKYSLADEKFYTTENLYKLKNNINMEFKNIKKEVVSSFLISIYICIKGLNIFSISFISICMLLLWNIVIKENRALAISFFIIQILICWMVFYIKPVYRVLLPLYMVTFVMMAYILTNINLSKPNVKNKQKNMKYVKLKKYIRLAIFALIFFSLIILVLLHLIYIYYLETKNDRVFELPKTQEVINYTNSHKENAYVYTSIFCNIPAAYSIYEKIEDNTFSNLRYISDWDIYDQEYYTFKEKYGLDNIMEDLYEKDNLYIITGDKAGNYTKLIEKYIKEHYNKDVSCKIIKKFPGFVNIYKFYEIKK